MTEQATDPQQTAPETPPEPTQAPEAPELKYGDKDLDKYKGNARKEGRQSATNELLQELGVESVDDLKAGYQSYAQAQEAAKSEADKLRESYGTVESERDQLQNTLADMRIERDLERRLLTEGVPADGMDRVMRLADTGDVAFDDDGNPDKDTLDAAIASVKETYPELFGEQQRQRVTGPDTSRPSGVPQGIDAQIADLKQQGKYAEAERLEANRFYAKQPG